MRLRLWEDHQLLLEGSPADADVNPVCNFAWQSKRTWENACVGGSYTCVYAGKQVKFQVGQGTETNYLQDYYF